ncbi:MAG: hypothetical protein IAB19_05880 [Proteobacteria bacterium]|uniref:GntR family transcriptional regulator n=1 Tax=Candidatus Avisuccinivibrio stercorigallinarum TaxID=2840704 RepID=A0A9D9DCN2_9GAMM|nr:hypothetical protein [Candidatus Avisuccinivibrio stercorigallinarum]
MSDKIPLGQRCSLKVTEIRDAGAYLDGQDFGTLFVPHSQLPKNLAVGSELEVFLYVDGGRVLATAKRPYLELGQIGLLRVNSIDCGTVYLDMGIPKELVVPVSEQRSYFEVGSYVMVFVAMDEEGRLFGTQRYNRYLSDFAPPHTYKKGDQAVIVPLSHTPLGMRVAVDDHYFGLLYRSECKGEVRIGRRMKGYIMGQRPDGHLDVSLQEPGMPGVEHAGTELLSLLRRSGGSLPFGDKSSPEEIEDYLHMSKGKFKKAIGGLYKQRLIELSDHEIKLTEAGRLQLEQGGESAEHSEAKAEADKGEGNA